jgi:hypothetical protein
MSSISRRGGRPPVRPPSRHRLGANDMPLEAKRCRHVAVTHDYGGGVGHYETPHATSDVGDVTSQLFVMVNWPSSLMPRRKKSVHPVRYFMYRS